MDLAKMQNADGEETGVVVVTMSTEEAQAVRDAIALRTELRTIIGRINTGVPVDAAPLSRLLGDEPGAASPVKRAAAVPARGASAARTTTKKPAKRKK